jgi:acetolactate synthase I/II/III large subunit
MNGADAIADVLIERRVDVVFTLCGNHLLPLYRALVDRGVRLLDTRTEASAVFAADGYARTSRRPGVALVTGGPGFTNGLTGLVTAHTAGSPVLLLSGASELARRGAGLHQEIDQVAPARTLAKFSAEATSADDVGALVRDALATSAASPSGAGSLVLPLDVLEGETASPRVGARVALTAESDLDDASLAIATSALNEARRPLMIVGQGAYWSRAEDAVAEYCHRASVPILTMDVARGSVPEDGQMCFGYPDTNLRRIGDLIGDADTVVVLGRPIDHRFGRAGDLFGTARIVVVGADPALPGHRGADVTCVAMPVPEFVKAIDGHIRPNLISERTEWLERLRHAYQASALRRADQPGPGAPLDPGAVAWAIDDVVPPDTAISLDSGDFVQWCRAIVRARGTGKWLRSGRMSTCGSGLPMAIGAAVASRSTVLAVTGDGSLGYGIADLETIARHDLPVVCVVGNNQAWGLEYNLQDQLYGPSYRVASQLGRVDFAAVARGFGVDALTVSSIEEFRAALAEGLAGSRPMLVEVPMTRAPSPLAQAVIERGGVV